MSNFSPPQFIRLTSKSGRSLILAVKDISRIEESAGTQGYNSFVVDRRLDVFYVLETINEIANLLSPAFT